MHCLMVHHSVDMNKSSIHHIDTHEQLDSEHDMTARPPAPIMHSVLCTLS
jgi:hypothetical protein